MTATQMTPAASNVTFQLRPEDHEFFERELASFVPDRVFDAHCHLWPAEQNLATRDVQVDGIPEGVGYAEYRTLNDIIHPGRDAAALFIPVPARGSFMP